MVEQGAQDVDTIGVGLTLDTSGFDAGLTRAKTALTGFETNRSRALKAPQAVAIQPSFAVNQKHVRALKVDINQHLQSMAARNEAVAVPVKLGQSDWAGMRSQIAQKIGSVPITVHLAGTQSGLSRSNAQQGVQGAGGSPMNVLRSIEAWIAQSQSISLPDANQRVMRAARSKGVAGLARGGRTTQGRTYLVGEEGPEIFRPNQPGRVIPFPRGVPTSQTLAIASSMVRMAGGQAEGPLTRRLREGPGTWNAPPPPQPPQPQPQQPFEPAWMRRARENKLPYKETRATGGRVHQDKSLEDWLNRMDRDHPISQAERRMHDAPPRDWWIDHVGGWHDRNTPEGRRIYEEDLALKTKRAQGGAAKRGGLPRGYSMVFEGRTGEPGHMLGSGYPTSSWNPEADRGWGWGTSQVAVSNYGQIKKPTMRGEHWPSGFSAVVRDRRGNVVANAPFDTAQEDGRNYITPRLTWVHPNHRGKGLANAMYVRAEKWAGATARPDWSQTEAGEALWEQPNRPFGRGQPSRRQAEHSEPVTSVNAQGHTVLHLGTENAQWVSSPLNQRARGGKVNQYRIGPTGEWDEAPNVGGMTDRVLDQIANYQTHSGPGGYVGVAPTRHGGNVVQLHAADGTIESWRMFAKKRMAGGGEVWKNLLQASQLKTRRMARRAANRYSKRYRGFMDSDLFMGGLGETASSILPEAELSERFSGEPSDIASLLDRMGPRPRRSETETLNRLWGRPPIRGASDLQHELREDQLHEDPFIPASFRGGDPRPMKNVLNILRRTLRTSHAHQKESGYVGTWEDIERGLKFLPKTRNPMEGTRPWGWPHHEATGRPKDLDFLPGQYTHDGRLRDVYGDVSGGNYPGMNAGLDQLKPKDFNDPTQFTDVGYKTIHGLMQDRGNARGGRVRGASSGLRGAMDMLGVQQEETSERFRDDGPILRMSFLVGPQRTPTAKIGTERELLEWGNGLKDRGIKVEPFTPRKRRGDMASGGPVDEGWTMPQGHNRGLMRLPPNARDLDENVAHTARKVNRKDAATWRKWYTIAHAQASGDLADFNFSGEHLSGIAAFAAASPGMTWPANRAAVRSMMHYGRPEGLMGSNVEDVPGYSPVSFGVPHGYKFLDDSYEHLLEENFTKGPTGPKRAPFFSNLSGLDPHALTLDSRMSQIVLRSLEHKGQYGEEDNTFYGSLRGTDQLRGLMKEALERQLKVWGPKLGVKNLSEFQAVLWSQHGGADLGTDWESTKSGIAIPRHHGLVVPYHRAWGGPATGAERMLHFGPEREPFEPHPSTLAEIDQYRHAPREHFLVANPNEFYEREFGGREFPRGQIEGILHGNKNSVDVSPFQLSPGSRATIGTRRNYSTGARGYGGASSLTSLRDLVEVHNHPGFNGNRSVWRPSNADIANMFDLQPREAWVTTPGFTTIMRPDPDVAHEVYSRDVFGMMSHAAGTALPHGVGRRFDKSPNSPVFLNNVPLWSSLYERLAKEFGLETEVWKHPEVAGGLKRPEYGRARPEQLEMFQRAHGGPAWRGKTADAYRNTLANEGGTFPALPGMPPGQPSKGFAVGIPPAGGTAAYVHNPQDPVEFMRAFHSVSRMAGEMGAPYVGTWLNKATGKIEIDPAIVAKTRREADMVARARRQLAIFGLNRFQEIPTTTKRLRAPFARIQEIIATGMPARGNIERVSVASLLGMRREDREAFPRTGQGATDLDELTADIAAHGFHDPVTIGYNPKFHSAGLHDGNHRLAAALRLGLKSIPAQLRSAPSSKRHFRDVNLEGSVQDLVKGEFYPPSMVGIRNRGGSADNGTYLVGELAPELFVPDRMRYIIPENVMSKIPKRDQGGNVRKMGSGVIEVGSRGPHLFTPPEDGWIVPHNLTGQVSPNIPRAAGGRSPLAGLLRTLKRNPADEAIADAVTSMRADARAELDLIEEGAVGALKQVSGSSPKTVMANIIASPNRQSLMQRQHRARTLARLTMHDWEMRGGGAEIAARGEATRPILAQAQAERGALLQYQQAKQADLTGLEARARKKLGVGAFTPDQVQAQMQAMAPVKYDQLTRIIKRNTEGLTKADSAIGKMTTTVAAGEAAQKSHTEALGHVTRAYEEAAPQLKDKMSAAVQTFAGFSLYGLAQQGISTALAAAVPQVTKWIDSVGGFTAENQKVTKQIGASLRQNGGNLTTTMGQLAMTSGLSGGAMGFLGASLGASSYAKGGGAAQTEKSDLFKAAANTTAPTGLVGGYGGLFGTNILGELLGGGKGYAEQIGLDTKDLAGKARGEMDLGKVFTNAVAGTPLVGGAAQMLGFGHANPMVSPEEARASAASLMAYSDDLNDAMKRGARAAGQTAYHFEQVGKDAAEATHWSDNLGTEAQDMAKGGLVLKDAAGQLVTGTKEYNTALQQGARGNTIATQEAYAAQQAQGLSATFASNAAQSSYALKMSLGGLGLGLAASPFVAGGTGILPGSSPTGMGGGWDKSVSGGFGKGNQYMGTGKSGLGAGFDKQMQAQIAGIDASQKTVTEEYNKYLDDMVAQLQKSLPAEVQIGPAPTVGYQSTPDHGDSGVNQTPVSTSVSTWDHGNAATAYSASSQLKDWTDQLKTSGKVIQGYNEQIGNIQAGQSSRSFANNMVMASRALSDALGLAGRAGGSNNLGAVQRQQTMLGFGMQQKQINFSVAMAGFQAPGLTSEERAARQEQAKIEAAYAQKQLNLSRQSFGITAGRGVEDAQRALVSLRADRAAELMIAAVNKKMATEVAHQATLQAKIQAKTQEAQGNFGAVLNAATGYVQTFGDTLQKATSAIATVLGIPDPYAKHASGIVGSTTGTTSMTVGEAGTEHVAVIRNPRMASLSALGGASGGATIVNVGGISLTVQGDVKDDATVAKITRAVEDMFNRKAARLGMRTYVSAQG